ncbi:putative Puromycin resistance protein pur8 [uncultured Microbacterium sp.]|uniref:Putative Puromycin resistance protein pur8 n=2 Tax=uncultured Microbacterium sp. TaxID=191216 RepID=A0A1Y5P3F4_9MICO|nr:putative Puromycin resistance protein pur8 [uncultured Microbacterium sp.]
MIMTSRRPASPLVLTLVTAQFVVMLDSSILNVALPSITTDLGLTPVGTAWVLNAYFLTFGGLLLISGRAADVFGRRRMFLLGAGVLVLGSLLGGFATTDAVLVSARLIQGAGAAMLSPAAMSVILARFTGPGRARAMSGWGAASTVGGAAGVTLGGILTAAFSWQSVLFVTGAVAAVVGVAGWFLLPAEKATTKRSFDAAGATLLTGAAVAVVFGVLSAPHRGLLSIEVVCAAILAVACVIGFVLVERRAADPVLPTGVLRDTRVSGGIAVNLLGGAARIACFVLVALLLQQVLEYGPAIAGLAMLPTSVAGFLISITILPRALDRLEPQWVALVGLVLLVFAHLIFATVDNGDSYLLRVLPGLLLAAAGVAFSFTPTTLVISEGIAAQNSGVSSGLASATAQLGGAIGIAVFGSLDATSRAAVLQSGGTSLAAADAGLQSANLAAAAAAGLAAVIALITFPALRRTRTAGSSQSA